MKQLPTRVNHVNNTYGTTLEVWYQEFGDRAAKAYSLAGRLEKPTMSSGLPLETIAVTLMSYTTTSKSVLDN